MLQARQRGVTRDLGEVEKEAAELPELTVESPGFFEFCGDKLLDCIELVLNGNTAGAVAVYSVLLLGIAIWMVRLFN